MERISGFPGKVPESIAFRSSDEVGRLLATLGPPYGLSISDYSDDEASGVAIDCTYQLFIVLQKRVSRGPCSRHITTCVGEDNEAVKRYDLSALRISDQGSESNSIMIRMGEEPVLCP